MPDFTVSHRQRIVYMDYNAMASRIDSYCDIIRSQFDAIVVILRGGTFLGLQLSFGTNLPVYFLQYNRTNNSPSWFSPPVPAGMRILLCEDIAGRGTTLIHCRQFLESSGYAVQSFVMFQDTYSSTRPDYCCYETKDPHSHFVPPWERYRINLLTNPSLADDVPDPDLFKTGWDLDGIFLSDLDPLEWAKGFPHALATRDLLPLAEDAPTLRAADLIITGRPEMDRARTTQWLHQQGLSAPLYLRNDGIEFPSALTTAQWKGATAIALGCTHYVESEAAQAIHMASLFPELQVSWWNQGQPVIINASLAQEKLRLPVQ